ncbi:MAG: MFS transporter [Saprospiraceae bacterium]|nr:MFS transporter [Saprospiraceae bacterium]
MQYLLSFFMMPNASQTKLYTKLTLLLASTITIMSGAAVAPALPKISEAFAYLPQAELLTKLILTLPSLLIAICSPFIGRFIDKHGRIRIFLFGIALYIVTGSAGFWLPGLTSILISRALLGVSIAINITTATTLAGDYFDGEERKNFLGTQAAMMALGGTLFVGAAGLLADISWRHPFLNYLIAIPVLFLCWRFLPEPTRPKKLENRARFKLSGDYPKEAWRIYLISFFGMAMFYIISVHHAYLIQEKGIEQSSIQSLGLILCTIFSAIASMQYSRVVRTNLGYFRIYALAFFGMALFYFLAGMVSSVWLTILFTGLSGLGAGLIMPNGNTWLLQLAPPEKRGQFMGGMTTAIFLGQFASPVLTQPMVRLTSLSGMHVIAAGLMLLLSVFFTLQKKPKS